MIDKIKAYGWQFVALALAVGLLVQTQRLADANKQVGKAETTLATERATAQRLAREQSEVHRKTERTLRENHDQIEGETKTALAAAATDADRARAAGQRLQRELAGYLTQHRARAIAAAAAGQCAPDAPAIDLLADLQRSADDRAGALAQFADDAHTRGLACERIHDSDHTTLNAAEASHAQTR